MSSTLDSLNNIIFNKAVTLSLDLKGKDKHNLHDRESYFIATIKCENSCYKTFCQIQNSVMSGPVHLLKIFCSSKPTPEEARWINLKDYNSRWSLTNNSEELYDFLLSKRLKIKNTLINKLNSTVPPEIHLLLNRTNNRDPMILAYKEKEKLIIKNTAISSINMEEGDFSRSISMKSASFLGKNIPKLFFDNYEDHWILCDLPYTNI